MTAGRPPQLYVHLSLRVHLMCRLGIHITDLQHTGEHHLAVSFMDYLNFDGLMTILNIPCGFWCIEQGFFMLQTILLIEIFVLT